MITVEMPAAFILSVNLTKHEAYSARPDAPVVPDVEAHRTQALRVALANGLVRAARAIAPNETTVQSPVRVPQRATVPPCHG
jgi:hypothetical protein